MRKRRLRAENRDDVATKAVMREFDHGRPSTGSKAYLTFRIERTKMDSPCDFLTASLERAKPLRNRRLLAIRLDGVPIQRACRCVHSRRMTARLLVFRERVASSIRVKSDLAKLPQTDARIRERLAGGSGLCMSRDAGLRPRQAASLERGRGIKRLATCVREISLGFVGDVVEKRSSCHRVIHRRRHRIRVRAPIESIGSNTCSGAM